MARKVVVTVVDDHDGISPATETVTFGLDGIAYEIDLSDTNAGSLRGFIEQWTPHARRTGKAARSRRTPPRTAGNRRAEVAAIRVWATENGHEISARGRIPTDVTDAYRAAATP
ncbi:Lsr2 family protein [Nocardia sp. NPDC050697]|uniref:histone-like nucleoid-structuring protein Lsr2 n=1 Tax=Nocardia sp. NPDC050697 TaxID=3155158 RepID=UPI0033FBC3E6